MCYSFTKIMTLILNEKNQITCAFFKKNPNIELLNSEY